MDALLVRRHRPQVATFLEDDAHRRSHEREVVLEPAVHVSLDADLDVGRRENLLDL
jgi:hypothetical protein